MIALPGLGTRESGAAKLSSGSGAEAREIVELTTNHQRVWLGVRLALWV